MNYEVESAIEATVRLAVQQPSVTELDIIVSNKTEMFSIFGYIIDFVKSNLNLHKLDLDSSDNTQFIIIEDNANDENETLIDVYFYDNTDEEDCIYCPGIMLLDLSSACIFDEV